ncbi:MAG: CHAP domain-containing protein [Oscillospiraceae bacterium]|nr:CHAP domain-containing protein [Oscillospiraceae bacterium]
MNGRIETVLAVAAGFIGTKESPKSSNNVIFNTHYYGREVSGEDYAWCVTFVWDVFRLAEMSALFYGGGKTASCERVLSYAKANGRFVGKTELRRGDLVLYRFPTNTRAANHIGIVTRADAKRVTAIEGNTAAGNDAGGGAVMERERDLTYVVGGYRPDYGKDDNMSDKEFAEYMERYLSAAGTGDDHSAWASAAIEDAIARGIVAGNGGGDFGWKKPLTKETAAQMIYNLLRSQNRERED